MKNNIVYVTSDLNNQELWHKQVELTELHWINSEPIAAKTYQARLRYRGPLIDCTIEATPKGAVVGLSEEQRGISAGQSTVIYDGETVIGGGIVA